MINVISKKEETRQRIVNFLYQLGLPVNLGGFKLLPDAIMLYMEDSNAKFTTGIYVDLAKMHNTAASRVERQIRHAIARIFEIGNPSALGVAYQSSSRKGGRMTSSQFIIVVSDIVAKQIDSGLRDNEKHTGVMPCQDP